MKKKTARPASPSREAGRASHLSAATPRRDATATAPRTSTWEVVYRVVRRIPRGRVMTYGQISEFIERRLSALAVGWAMHGCPDDVPWHRVVNARGTCSTDAIGRLPQGFQRRLLEKEGVRFRMDGRLDLERYRFEPRRR